MGLLSAIGALGQRSMELADDGPLADVSSFTQMPAEDPHTSTRPPVKEIQVILDVADPQAQFLDVRGIKRIQPADFWAGNEDDRYKKTRYLYRDPPSNTTWSYAPIYDLKQGVTDGRKQLLGNDGEGDWKNTKSRFDRLYNRVLHGFEVPKGKVSPIFSKGSADRIMTALVERIDELVALWTDRQRSYLLILGLSDDQGHFLYPAEIPAFLKYFRECVAENTKSKGVKGKIAKNRAFASNIYCSVCHLPTATPTNLDKVFGFATFDKASFFPGLDKLNAGKKVFPICQNCFELFSEGRNVIDKNFLDTKSIRGLNIYTIPELISGNDELDIVTEDTRNFLQNGVQNEGFLGPCLLECDNGLIYHFLFWEPNPKNPKQMRILLMVEDVPPTRLRRLNDCWKQSVSAFPFLKQSRKITSETQAEGATLWQAVNIIRGAMLELGRQNNADASVIRDWLLGLLGHLLLGERIDVHQVKKLIVSRLQGLCADGDWVQKHSKDSAKAWNVIVDFLYRANGSENADAE